MTFLQYTEMLLSQMAVLCLKRPARKESPVKAAKISKNASRYTGSHEAFFYRRYHNYKGGLVENRIVEFAILRFRLVALNAVLGYV